MRKLITALACLMFTAGVMAATEEAPVAIVIHGGAGTILKKNLTPELEEQYKATLRQAAEAGYKLLQQGEPGEMAVIAAIQIMETSPLFNAGIGAVYTWDEDHELDASIMHGGTHNAGAVAGVKTIRSPIAAASAVLHNSPHVMLSGKGAETFAAEQGLEIVDNDVFDTDRRYQSLKRAKERMESAGVYGEQRGNERFGTVGAVVLDKKGNLVAGTSTGGMTAKRYDRIGDAPVIGAGTWADNESCAVSSTGHGEFFIRYHVAADICARMKYQNIPLAQAADTVIFDVLKEAGGDGGVIAIDHDGNIATPFNSAGMYRAKIDKQGTFSVGIYKNWE